METGSWMYEGPAELSDPAPTEVDRIVVDVELTIAAECEPYGEMLVPLRSWGGTASVTDRASSRFLDGRYEIVLPTGQRGESYVSTSIEHRAGEQRITLHVQGAGEPPWLMEPPIG